MNTQKFYNALESMKKSLYRFALRYGRGHNHYGDYLLVSNHDWLEKPDKGDESARRSWHKEQKEIAFQLAVGLHELGCVTEVCDDGLSGGWAIRVHLPLPEMFFQLDEGATKMVDECVAQVVQEVDESVSHIKDLRSSSFSVSVQSHYPGLVLETAVHKLAEMGYIATIEELRVKAEGVDAWLYVEGFPAEVWMKIHQRLRAVVCLVTERYYGSNHKAAVARSWVKSMFGNPNTGGRPVENLLFADDRLVKLVRSNTVIFADRAAIFVALSEEDFTALDCYVLVWNEDRVVGIEKL